MIDRYPVNDDGQLLTHGSIEQHQTEENTPIREDMQIIGYYKGRSASNLELKSRLTGRKFPMSLRYFTKQACQHCEGGWITGTFHVVRRGSAYLLEMVQSDAI